MSIQKQLTIRKYKRNIVIILILIVISIFLINVTQITQITQDFVNDAFMFLEENIDSEYLDSKIASIADQFRQNNQLTLFLSLIMTAMRFGLLVLLTFYAISLYLIISSHSDTASSGFDVVAEFFSIPTLSWIQRNLSSYDGELEFLHITQIKEDNNFVMNPNSFHSKLLFNLSKVKIIILRRIEPIKIDKKGNNHIIFSGHFSKYAAAHLGYEYVPCKITSQ